MTRKPREILNEFIGGLQEVGTKAPDFNNAFMGLLGNVYKDGALTTKVKELISVAIGTYNRCEYCITFHIYKALEAGATREEVLEAAETAVAFGGGPSMGYLVSLVKDSIDEFAPDFNK